MWRVLGLTLVFVAAATTAAKADGGLAVSAKGIETALHESAAVAGKGHWAQRAPGQALQLQVGGALALAQPSLQASLGADSARRYLAPQLLSGRRQEDPSHRPALARWFDFEGARPTLAYPVNNSLSLGLRYSYQRGEDLVFKVAKTGALDAGYQNHKVLLRAQWEF